MQTLLGEQISVLCADGLLSLYCLCNEEAGEFLIYSTEEAFHMKAQPLAKIAPENIVSINAMETMIEIFYDSNGEARTHCNPNTIHGNVYDMDWINGVQRYVLCNLKPLQSRIWHLHLSETLLCKKSDCESKKIMTRSKTHFADDASDDEEEVTETSDSQSFLVERKSQIELSRSNSSHWKAQANIQSTAVKEQQEELRLQVKNMDFTRATVSYYTHVNFNMNVFITEFWTHVFYPFTIPYIYWKLGSTYFRNHGFLNISILPVVVFNQLIPILMWFLVIFFFINAADLRRENIYFIETLQIILYLAAHRATISCKYALMTNEERQLAYTCTDERKVTKLHLMIQLLTGWINPTGELTQSELYATALRMQCNLNAYAFMLDPYDADQQESWKKYLMMDKADPRYADWQSNKWPDFSKPVSQVPLAQLMTALFRRAVDKENSKAPLRNYLKIVISVLKGIIPGLIRVFGMNQSFSGSTVTSNIVVFVGMFCLMEFFNVILNIIQSSIVHYSRRYRMVKELGRLIRTDFNLHEELPVLATSNPANIVAWTELRNIAINFGSRYSLRLQYYTSFTLFVSGMYFAWFVGEVLLSLMTGETSGGINYILLAEVLYDSVLWTTLILVVTLIGTRTNRHNFIQRVYLSQATRKFLDSVWVCRKRGFPRISWLTEWGYLNFRIPFGNIRADQQAMRRILTRKASFEATLAVSLNRRLSGGVEDEQAEALMNEPSVDDRERFASDVMAYNSTIDNKTMTKAIQSPLTEARDIYVPELLKGLDAVERAQLQLQVQDTNDPETVLGIRADVALTTGLITMLVSVLVFATQKFMI